MAFLQTAKQTEMLAHGEKGENRTVKTGECEGSPPSRESNATEVCLLCTAQVMLGGGRLATGAQGERLRLPNVMVRDARRGSQTGDGSSPTSVETFFTYQTTVAYESVLFEHSNG